MTAAARSRTCVRFSVIVSMDVHWVVTAVPNAHVVLLNLLKACHAVHL